ncbi:MAG: hypothetical protein KF846_12880 [Cyclobacteriaceae bacterium]|nr:hypothetical protein [Cyclobacteriaceae bacterium]
MKSVKELNPAIIEIIEDAIKAPSGHNTQPWKFEVDEMRIIIKPDFARSLKVVDADNHALFISLGCALENLILSAKAHRFNPSVTMNFTNDKNEISIALSKSEIDQKDALYDYISMRQCTRSAYEAKSVEESILRQLRDSAINEDTEVIFITSKTEIADLESFIVEGSNLQFNNRQFVNELVSWIRFSKRSAEKLRDGIWSASMGMPGIGKRIGSVIMKHLVSAQSEARRWKKLISKSAGFALFISNKNGRENWVRLGQSFQRFALTATQLKLKHAHVNMPCEENPVRQKIIQHFNILNDKQPLLLIRFGYGEVMPYSFRRSVDEVLVNYQNG